MKFSSLILATILFSNVALAGTSASLHLTGTVAKKLDVSIDVASATLDLTVNKTDFKVATVTEKANSNNGYKITVASANLSKLKRVGGTEVFAYTLKYGTSTMLLTTAAGVTETRATTGVISQTKDVLISYTGAAPETMVEGSYEDDLTFTIAAN
jgi:hypothetical protein